MAGVIFLNILMVNTGWWTVVILIIMIVMMMVMMKMMKLLALEPRSLTRYEVRRWAREAYSLGVRYIGGCCGFEPYHIRAIAEELSPERGHLPEGTDKSDPDLTVMKVICDSYSGKTDVETMYGAYKCSKDYWLTLEPSTGRPKSLACSKVKN